MSAHTLGDIAAAIGARLEGIAERAVAGMAPLDQAGPNDLCFADSVKHTALVQSTKAAGVIVGTDFPTAPAVNLLRVDDVKRSYIKALELFVEPDHHDGVHPSAVVADDVELGSGVGIGPLVVIESGVTIGAGSRIHSGAFIGRDTRIGPNCIIGVNAVLLNATHLGARCSLQPGVVLGSDGYGYQWQDDHHHKIPQIGRVVVGDDVEIGANTCIDRATLGETRIGSGSKFDNLVHIAHNNVIGKHVLLTGQVGIAGSSRLGDGVVAGGQAAVTDHVHVGGGVQIAGQSGVAGDIKAGEKVWGTPARPIAQAMRAQALVGKLPETRRKVRGHDEEISTLCERIAALEAKLAE